MESEADQLAVSSHNLPCMVKCEPVVKEEPEWGECGCGADQAIARADLYEGHEIKEDLAFGPELLQEQDITRTIAIQIHLETELEVKLEPQTAIKKEAGAHESDGSDSSDAPRSNGDMVIKEEKCPYKLDPPKEVKCEPELVYACPWEVLRSMSLEQQFKLRSCFVRLERVPLGSSLTANTGPKTLHAQAQQSTVGISCCNFCGKRFTKKSDFTRHVRIHTGEKPYSCDVCNKRFADKSRLTRHLRVHKREAQHSCDVCQKRFVQKSDFNKHALTHMGEKPHTCHLCDKTFAKQSDLARHIRAHTGEKPYSCDVCEKQFADRSSLTRHKRVHSGVKLYTCNICHKRFVQKSHLNRHVLIHTGEKPFICDVCDRRFTQKQTLIGHLRMHTGEKPYDCHMCHKKFVAKSPLTKHLKGHEKKKPFSFHTGMRQTVETTCPRVDDNTSILKTALVKNKRLKPRSKTKPTKCESDSRTKGSVSIKTAKNIMCVVWEPP